jgi:hypothetical protein
MTDGFGPAPLNPPVGIDVIWVLIGEEVRKPWPAEENVSRIDTPAEINWGSFVRVRGEERQTNVDD